MKNLLACYANCRYSTKCDDLRNEIINNTEQASSDINKYLGEHGRKPITIQLMKRGLKFSEVTVPELTSGSKKILPRAVKMSAPETPKLKAKSITRTDNQPITREDPAKLSTKIIKKIRKKSAKSRTTRARKSKEASLEATTVRAGRKQGAFYLEKSPVSLKKKKAAKRRAQFSNIRKIKTSASDSVAKLATVKMKNRKSAAMPRRQSNESNSIPAEREQVLDSPAPAQEVSASNKAKMIKPARSKKRTAATRGRSSNQNGKVYIILEGKSANVVDEQGLMMHLFTNPSSSARYFEASEVEARVQIIKK